MVWLRVVYDYAISTLAWLVISAITRGGIWLSLKLEEWIPLPGAEISYNKLTAFLEAFNSISLGLVIVATTLYELFVLGIRLKVRAEQEMAQAKGGERGGNDQHVS
jgi:hypothetical protein